MSSKKTQRSTPAHVQSGGGKNKKEAANAKASMAADPSAIPTGSQTTSQGTKGSASVQSQQKKHMDHSTSQRRQ